MAMNKSNSLVGVSALGFAIIIVGFAAVGIVVNVACLYNLRKHRSVFHRYTLRK